MMTIEVYTDGSATTKDKPGGWAYAIVVNGRKIQEGSGAIPNATNNDAELEAAIKGLTTALYLKTQIDTKHEFYDTFNGECFETHLPPKFELCSDSEIVLGWANGRYRFKQHAKMEKFRLLKELVHRLGASTRWVEGHAGHEFNELCDKLARAARNEAMGIVKKPRVDRNKNLKEACKKMSETLEWIRKEMLQMEAEGVYVRHDIEDQCDAALEFYAEKLK
jgi:ribonuclease HI